jgi:hypothetical protein
VSRFFFPDFFFNEDSKFEMIVEPLAKGTVKNLNLSVDFALGESLNDTFKTNGRIENLKFPLREQRVSACKNLD